MQDSCDARFKNSAALGLSTANCWTWAIFLNHFELVFEKELAIRHHQPSCDNDAHMFKGRQGIVKIQGKLNYKITRQIIYTV